MRSTQIKQAKGFWIQRCAKGFEQACQLSFRNNTEDAVISYAIAKQLLGIPLKVASRYFVNMTTVNIRECR